MPSGGSGLLPIPKLFQRNAETRDYYCNDLTLFIPRTAHAHAVETSVHVEAMSSICVGCGKHLVASDTRCLHNSSDTAQIVLDTWNTLVSRRSDVYATTEGWEVKKMCRNCFNAYHRFKTLQSSIEENLASALEEMSDSLPTSNKRQRLSSHSAITASSSNTHASVSPDVAVSNYSLYI